MSKLKWQENIVDKYLLEIKIEWMEFSDKSFGNTSVNTLEFESFKNHLWMALKQAWNTTKKIFVP